MKRIAAVWCGGSQSERRGKRVKRGQVVSDLLLRGRRNGRAEMRGKERRERRDFLRRTCQIEE